MRQFAIAIAITIGFAAASLAALGQTEIHVPADVPQIVDAVNLAQDGDVIVVGEGTWFTPKLNIAGKSLTLRSFVGQERATLYSAAGDGIIDFAGTGTETLRLEGLTFTGVSGAASPVTLNDARLVCLQCSFDANACAGKGGAVSVLAIQHDTELFIQSCRMRWNFAAIAGGCINLEAAADDCFLTAAISSTIFDGNVCDDGSVLYANNGSTLLISFNNATIYGNISRPFGELVRLISEAGTIGYFGSINNVVRANTPHTLLSTAGSQPGSNLAVNVVHSNIEGGHPGYQNFDSDPQFVNPALGDFHLQASSPCLDAGGGASSFVSWDADGSTRVQGGAADIGAFEFRAFDFLPGTGEGLAIEASVYHAVGAAYPHAGEGDVVHVYATPESELTQGAPIAILAQVSALGARPPSPDEFPEVHVNPWLGNDPIVLVNPFNPAHASNFLGPVAVVAEVLPLGMFGHEVVVQALALTAGAENGFFAASRGLRIPVY